MVATLEGAYAMRFRPFSSSTSLHIYIYHLKNVKSCNQNELQSLYFLSHDRYRYTADMASLCFGTKNNKENQKKMGAPKMSSPV